MENASQISEKSIIRRSGKRVHDEMIPVANSYRLGEHLPNAVLLTYPDSGHARSFNFPSRSRVKPKTFSHRIPVCAY